MRASGPRRAVAALLVSATAVTTAASCDTGDGPGPLSRLVLPPAAAVTLPAFDGCEELRRWYVAGALPQVGPWGFEAPYPAIADRATAAEAAGPADQAVGSSDSGTNVQETGVDEPDLAKTDGEILVRVADGDLVVADVSGDQARRLSRLPLPGGSAGAAELLLVGDTVLVVGTAGWWSPVADTAFRALPDVTATRTHLVSVDVSDPAAPRVTGRQRVDGSLVAAREYGDGTVRVVVSTGLPDLRFVHPGPGRSPRDARRENRAVVRESTIRDWLPGVRRGDGRDRQPLLDCADVRHPARDAGTGTLSVLTFPIGDPGAMTATAVTAAGDLAYSSAHRLYVGTIDAAWWDVVPLASSRSGRGDPPTTQLHAFALDAGTTSYVASGSVPGTVRDRWSLSEHEGRLRVATALGRGWQPRENAVHVLEEVGPRLRVVGTVGGLGPDEQIQSVRWLGDLAVVVTFRQTDPLYTVDLTDPAHPRVLGELKIRGFSAYLHPVGGGRLLGLGRDATRTGQDLGAQAAVFDLADVAAVRRTGVIGLGRSVELGTRWEPRAFTYLPERGLALVPVEDWVRGEVRLLALRLGTDGRVVRAGSWPVGRWGAASVRALPLGGDRVAVVHHGVEIVRVG